ncbi:MAG: hypothetical protein ACJ79A_16280 [Gemmatimonadaceae bacterium]
MRTFNSPAAVREQATDPASRWRAFFTLGLLAVVLSLALLQCRAWNALPNADGISYLELAARYARGDATAVANGYWSPLYPALLGAAQRMATVAHVRTDGAVPSELQVALVVNMVIVTFATLAVAQLLWALHTRVPTTLSPMQRVARLSAGGAVWLWCCVRLIGATAITPDMLIAAWLSLATAELVAMAGEPPSIRRAGRLAVILALGYWTKAVFFPVMIAGALAYMCLARGTRISARLAPLGIALALAAPLVTVQSVSQGHLTFGETGRLNYDWYVNDIPKIAPRFETVAQSRSRRNDAPRVVQLASSPHAALYTGELPGSFPFWHDATRYVERRPLVISWPAQWRVIRANLHWYRVVAGALALPCLVVLAAGVGRAPIERRRSLAAVPALSLAGLHLLSHPEGRLAGAAIATLLTLTVYLNGSPRGAAPARAAAMLWAIEYVALAVVSVLALGRVSERVSLGRAELARSPAERLTQLGLRPGDRVALVGSPFGQYWAHQAGVRIAVTVDVEPTAPPSGSELTAIAAESCARGYPLAAILSVDGGLRYWPVRNTNCAAREPARDALVPEAITQSATP